MGQAPSREDGLGQPSAQPGEGASSGEGASTALVGQGSASLPGEETVVPTVLQWSHGGNSVYVTGSFNNWGERIPMRRSGNDCVVCLNLLPGTYQYKFIVDNEWRYAPEQPTVRDELGNVNNCVAVEDQSAYMREDPQSGFFNDTYPNMYSQSLPDEITLAKEPPQAPVHLWCLPINIPPVEEPRIAAWTLHPPLSGTLTHVHVARSSPVTMLAVTQRFRAKFVTVVIYKPRGRPASPGRPGGDAQQDAQACGSSEAPAEPACAADPPSAQGAFKVPQLPATTRAVGGKRPIRCSWSDQHLSEPASETDVTQAHCSGSQPSEPPAAEPAAQPMDVAAWGPSQHASSNAMMDVG